MELVDFQKAFNHYLDHERIVKSPEQLYEPIQYIMQLGGKRIRPILAMMAYNLYEDNLEGVLPIAFAIELFHNFTLMHDDIMDVATLRRGKKAVHQKYGLNSGILSGDVMLLLAYEYLLSSGVSLSDIRLFNHAAIQICEGQQFDMNFESGQEVSIIDYMEMIKLKTAVLLGLALQLGAKQAGASQFDVDHLYQFGLNMGIAFQLHDDMLDAFGSSLEMGKKQGGDILQRKQTYLHIKTKELLGKEELERFLAVFNSTDMADKERLAGVMSFYRQTAVKEYSLQTEEAYFNLAISHLDAIQVDNNNKSALRKLAHQLMERSF